jgi:hypothetical protein
VGCGVGDVVFPEQETIVRPTMATARRAGRNESRLLTARSLLLRLPGVLNCERQTNGGVRGVTFSFHHTTYSL